MFVRVACETLSMQSRPLVLATLEGYNVEGGLDLPGTPHTCFAPTIALGRHEGPGGADNLWRDYERVLDAAALLPLDGVRLGLEWARLAPRPGLWDGAALARYQEVIDYAASLHLQVTVALVGEAWPSWLGLEAWLLPWVAPEVVSYVTRCVEELRGVRGFVVFANAGDLVRRGYLEGTAPPWRQGARDDEKSATSQITSIMEQLSRREPVASQLIVDALTFDVHDDLDDVIALNVSEVHVRSLVKGTGPTRAPHGLLVRHAGEWRLSPEGDAFAAKLR
jgi:beta-glucosidase/6-phospho-beta-glucosidase/beta-galactosidase